MACGNVQNTPDRPDTGMVGVYLDMERGGEDAASVEIEFEEAAVENEGGDDVILLDTSRKIREGYKRTGVPDFYTFEPVYHGKFRPGAPNITLNDFYLWGDNVVPSIAGPSLRATARKYKDYPLVSGFIPETFEYLPEVDLYQPRHGETVGGKGLGFYTHPVIYLTAGMSTIVNFAVSFGCPANCFRLEGNETVITRDGEILLGDVIKNRMNVEILDPDGEYVPVVDWFDNGEKEVWEFEDADGDVYVCTPEHPFMTEVDGVVVELPIGEIFRRGLKVLKERKDAFCSAC